ncbi:hypothetical protein HPB51_014767 [Rhipicephalus microplus]|uniref:Uncharacterized protein n=1 Tax=Rhipicephalus microplus TaxID=6941 RepID=A0A9J6DNC1_RHIMP|nr:hypothetical protein HPB51_014767 [Rhipicephalus microplus]
MPTAADGSQLDVNHGAPLRAPSPLILSCGGSGPRKTPLDSEPSPEATCEKRKKRSHSEDSGCPDSATATDSGLVCDDSGVSTTRESSCRRLRGLGDVGLLVRRPRHGTPRDANVSHCRNGGEDRTKPGKRPSDHGRRAGHQVSDVHAAGAAAEEGATQCALGTPALTRSEVCASLRRRRRPVSTLRCLPIGGSSSFLF